MVSMATNITQGYPTPKTLLSVSLLPLHISWIVSFVCPCLSLRSFKRITGSIEVCICSKYHYWNLGRCVMSSANTVILKTFMLLPGPMTSKCTVLANKWTFYQYRSMWITRFPWTLSVIDNIKLLAVLHVVVFFVSYWRDECFHIIAI